jgi:hypothetical protein
MSENITGPTIQSYVRNGYVFVTVWVILWLGLLFLIWLVKP